MCSYSTDVKNHSPRIRSQSTFHDKVMPQNIYSVSYSPSIKRKITCRKLCNIQRRLAVDFLVNSGRSTTNNRPSDSSRHRSQFNVPSNQHPLRQSHLTARRSGARSTVASLPRHHGRPRLRYHLEVVQQPQRAAEFGASSLTRLPLGPPLIVQLVVRDMAGNILLEEDELPFLISHLSLFTGDGSDSPITNEPQGLLYGSLVSSPQLFRDLQGRQGIYFLFPDVSIRTRGHFQMLVSLIRLPSMEPPVPGQLQHRDHVLAETRTNQFQVVPREDYVAPSQTDLTRYFLEQGARMYAFAHAVPH